jgi:hypothetical protein
MSAMILGSWLNRLPNGDEFMSGSTNIKAFAESQLGRDAIGSVTLPAEILENERLGRPSFATGCVELPLAFKISQQW